MDGFKVVEMIGLLHLLIVSFFLDYLITITNYENKLKIIGSMFPTFFKFSFLNMCNVFKRYPKVKKKLYFSGLSYYRKGCVICIDYSVAASTSYMR